MLLTRRGALCALCAPLQANTKLRERLMRFDAGADCLEACGFVQDEVDASRWVFDAERYGRLVRVKAILDEVRTCAALCPRATHGGNKDGSGHHWAASVALCERAHCEAKPKPKSAVSCGTRLPLIWFHSARHRTG